MKQRVMLGFVLMILLAGSISNTVAQDPFDAGFKFEKVIFSEELHDGDQYAWKVVQAEGLSGEFDAGVAEGDEITVDVVGDQREFTAAEVTSIYDTFVYKINDVSVNPETEDAFLALNLFILPVAYVINGTTFSITEILKNENLVSEEDLGGAFNVTVEGDDMTMELASDAFGNFIFKWDINTGLLQLWYFTVSVPNFIEATLRIQLLQPQEEDDDGDFLENLPLPAISIFAALVALPVARRMSFQK